MIGVACCFNEQGCSCGKSLRTSQDRFERWKHQAFQFSWSGSWSISALYFNNPQAVHGKSKRANRYSPSDGWESNHIWQNNLWAKGRGSENCKAIQRKVDLNVWRIKVSWQETWGIWFLINQKSLGETWTRRMINEEACHLWDTAQQKKSNPARWRVRKTGFDNWRSSIEHFRESWSKREHQSGAELAEIGRVLQVILSNQNNFFQCALILPLA